MEGSWGGGGGGCTVGPPGSLTTSTPDSGLSSPAPSSSDRFYAFLSGEGFASASLRPATLRQKLCTEVAMSAGDMVLRPGSHSLALTLQHLAGQSLGTCLGSDSLALTLQHLAGQSLGTCLGSDSLALTLQHLAG